MRVDLPAMDRSSDAVQVSHRCLFFGEFRANAQCRFAREIFGTPAY